MTAATEPLTITQADIEGAFRTLCGRDILPHELERYQRLGAAYRWNHYSLLMHILCHLEAQNRLEFPAIVQSGVTIDARLHNGMTIFGPISDLFVTHTIRRKGQWEAHEEGVMRKMVRPGMKVVDIGANVGYFTAVLSELAGPQGHVWAVEAAPALARCLAKSKEHNRWENVTIVNHAVSDKAGALLIGYNFVNWGASQVHPVPPGHVADGLWNEIVQAQTLDELIPAGQKIDFIKMDIEGHEGHAVCGMERVLRESKPSLLWEYSPGSLANGPLPPQKFFEFLEKLGYKFATVKALCRLEESALTWVPKNGLDTAGILAATQEGNYDQWNLVAVCSR